MNQEQMLLAAAKSRRDLRHHPLDEVHQVVPVLARPDRPVGLLNDTPVDVERCRLLAEGVEQEVVKRDPLQRKPPL